MSKKQIFNIFLMLVLLIFPLSGSAFAEDVQPAEVKESIEKNENFENREGSATEEQKAKMKAEREKQEAIKKAKIEREKAEREEQEAIKKAKIEWEKASREKQEAMKKERMEREKASREEQEAMKKKRIEEQEAKKKAPIKNVNDEYWMIKEMGGVK